MRDKLTMADSLDASVIYAKTIGGQYRRLKAHLRVTVARAAFAFATMLMPAGASLADTIGLQGTYVAECYGPDGKLKWRDTFKNTVVTVGKNHTLDNELAGSAYTVTGPYMGLISSTSFTAIAAADTMSSHSGWLEAGNAHAPTYSGTRATAAWSAASGGSKSLSAALVFNITGSGTIKGAFLVLGSGAVNTIDNTSGTLFSAGLFTGGDKTVGNGDVVNVSYTCSA